MNSKSLALVATLLGTSAVSAATGTVAINAGGPAIAPFVADMSFSGGSTISNWTGAVNTSLVTNPAPQEVYQTERYGAFSYKIGGLVAGTSYTVNLHFTEDWETSWGKRLENVSINGVQVLTNFDIFAATGAKHKAIKKVFTTNSDNNGNINISFSPAPASQDQNAKVDGIEIIGAVSNSPPAQLSWSADNSTKCDGVNFSTGGATSGSVSFTTPNTTTTYSMNCTGPNGSGGTSVTLQR